MADLEPRSLEIQREVGLQIQRSQAHEDVVSLFAVLERAIGLETDPARRRTIQAVLCSQLPWFTEKESLQPFAPALAALRSAVDECGPKAAPDAAGLVQALEEIRGNDHEP